MGLELVIRELRAPFHNLPHRFLFAISRGGRVAARHLHELVEARAARRMTNRNKRFVAFPAAVNQARAEARLVAEVEAHE
jgi:hypothetical protein